MLPALIVGNTGVLNLASDVPLSAFNLVQALRDARLPPVVVNFVTGRGAHVGEPLLRHPEVKGISFIGGTATGQQIARNSCEIRNGGKPD